MSKLAELDIDGTPALASLKKLSDGIEHIEEKIKGFGMAFAGIGIAFEAVMKITEGFEGVLNLGAQMESLHLATGESVHDLVIFGHALDLAGAGAEGAENFIFRLQRAISGVNEEGKSTAVALHALGLSQKDLKDKSILEQTELLSQGFARVANQADKAAIAGDLFGKRQGAAALRVFANPEAFELARKQAEPLADVMEHNAQKFHELEAAIKGVGENMKGFFAGALEGVTGDSIGVAHALASIDFVDIGRGVGQILDVFVQLGKVFITILPAINAVAKALESVLSNPGMRGLLLGAAAGTIIGPEGTVIGGILGAAGGLLFGGGRADEKKGFAEGFKGLQPESLKQTPVSALQRVGLGGGFGSGNDPLLAEARQTNSLLTQIRDKAGGSTIIPGIPDFPPV